MKNLATPVATVIQTTPATPVIVTIPTAIIPAIIPMTPKTNLFCLSVLLPTTSPRLSNQKTNLLPNPLPANEQAQRRVA